MISRVTTTVRKRLKRWLIIGTLLAVGWAAFVCIRIVRFSSLDERHHADCIILLGAAVHSGRPSPVFEQRIRHAVQLFHGGVAPRIIFTGGVGKGSSVAESEVGKDFAVSLGIPVASIFTEKVSHTTFQNLSEAQRIMNQRQWESAILVSDPYHMFRATRMAQHLGIRSQSSPTTTSVYRSFNIRFTFLLRELYFVHHFQLFRI